MDEINEDPNLTGTSRYRIADFFRDDDDGDDNVAIIHRENITIITGKMPCPRRKKRSTVFKPSS